ncbi:hypothetical protein ES703_82638 [subsurface metagenome]
MDLTWGNIGVILTVLVVVSFVAGAIDTWWEQHKGEKGKWG